MFNTIFALISSFVSSSHFGLTHAAFTIQGIVLDWNTSELVIPRPVGATSTILASDLLFPSKQGGVNESLQLSLKEFDEFLKQVGQQDGILPNFIRLPLLWRISMASSNTISFQISKP